MKRPSFQFYPGDWLHDAALRSCSVGARGLWVEMICLMHQGSEYGFLKVNHTPILAANLARMAGATIDETEGWLSELEAAGVFSRDESGCIFSRRMIRDENVRLARAAGGKLGGNPALLGSTKAQEKVNHSTNLQPTPSSSSSPSSSVKEKEPSVLGAQPSVETHRIGIPDCPHKEILALWAEVLPSLPQHSEWNAIRRKHLQCRWREKAVEKGWSSQADGLAFFRRLFAYVGQSPWLTGRVISRDPSRQTFVVELEWLIKPANFAKVIEGKYHQEKAA